MRKRQGSKQSLKLSKRTTTGEKLPEEREKKNGYRGKEK